MAAYNEKLKGGGHELALESGSGDIPAVEDFTSSSDYEPGVLASLRRFEARMDKALGVESEAIEFGLSLKQSLLIYVFASILGGLVSSYCATFASLGWASVATISGGLALTAVADGHISLVIGVIIIALVLLAISFLGLKYILIYERYAWCIYFIVFMIIFGMVGPYADSKTPASSSGIDLWGNVLSLIAIVYGSSASWATMALDYYVHYLANTSRLKVWLLTTAGIGIPTVIGITAGAMVASALNNIDAWKTAYTGPHQGLCFLIRDMLHPRGFANFLLVLLSFSGININIMSLYLSAISFQQMATPCAKVPRFVWTLGMVETWFTGPLGKLIGTYGGDVANELTFVVTAIVYPVARYFELKYFSKYIVVISIRNQ
ncbi:Uncharacterized protein HZ326_29551 [Fusarium oxysporum f. sp. albedinis]|nr:Uncharacterized protein HZ326_29551 [Fusarium oxysporum f. sp. albedinis]